MFTLNQLSMFVKVTEKGSFSKAAEEAQVTANAVAKQMKLLEEEFGVKLLEKQFKGQTLTTAGEKLYKNAKKLLELCENSVKEVQETELEAHNTIRIGTSVVTPMDIFDDLYVRIRKAYPEYTFKLVPFENVPDEKGLVVPYPGNTFDIYVSSYDENMLEQRNLNAFEVAKAPLYAIMSVNHRLADKEVIEHSDLAGETIITGRRGKYAFFDEFVNYITEKENVEVKEVFSYSPEIYNECASGNEIMLGMGNLTKIHPLLHRVPIRWEKTSLYGFVYSKEPTPKVVRFIDKLELLLRG